MEMRDKFYLLYLNKCSILHLYSRFCESINMSSHHGSFSTFKCFKEVTSWSQTESLLPWIVGWGEMFLKLFPEIFVFQYYEQDFDVLRCHGISNVLLHELYNKIFGPHRIPGTQLVEQCSIENLLPSKK